MNTNQFYDQTSLTLLGLARNNDQSAWQRLVQIYSPLVLNWTKKAGVSESDSVDINQDVWGSVSQGLEKFRKDTEGQSFRAWLWTITRNKIRDLSRRRVLKGEGGTDAQQRILELAEKEPADESMQQNSAKILYKALDLVRDDFEENTWQAFWRLTVLGQSARDIAKDLNMAPNSVHQARFRILKRLRTEIENLQLVDEPSFQSFRIFE